MKRIVLAGLFLTVALGLTACLPAPPPPASVDVTMTENTTLVKYTADNRNMFLSGTTFANMRLSNSTKCFDARGAQRVQVNCAVLGDNVGKRVSVKWTGNVVANRYTVQEVSLIAK